MRLRPSHGQSRIYPATAGWGDIALLDMADLLAVSPFSFVFPADQIFPAASRVLAALERKTRTVSP